jgi:hypothetical protein
MLSSLVNYSHFVYTITDRFPSVKRSTLVLKPMGAAIGELEGTLDLEDDISLRVYEVINFAAATLTYYSYTVHRGDEKLYWYDPQPHPDNLTLSDTHPHHKHVPPDIKHNRVPASGLTFNQPNLPFLIREIEETLLTSTKEPPARREA